MFMFYGGSQYNSNFALFFLSFFPARSFNVQKSEVMIRKVRTMFINPELHKIDVQKNSFFVTYKRRCSIWILYVNCLCYLLLHYLFELDTCFNI